MNFLKNITWSPINYANTAVIAREAAEGILTRLDWMTIKPKQIVDVGCGIGEMSRELQKRYPEACVVACDQSEAMLMHARQTPSTIHYAHAEGDNLPFRKQSVDLIVANFLLPWQAEPHKMLAEWFRILTPNGLVIFSALGPDTLKEYQTILSEDQLPVLADVHDIGDALVQTGFSDPVLDVDYFTLAYRDKSHLLNELCQSGMWMPRDQAHKQAVQAALTANAMNEYALTYEVIFAHAFAPETTAAFKPSQDGVVRIPISSLRKKKE